MSAPSKKRTSAASSTIPGQVSKEPSSPPISKEPDVLANKVVVDEPAPTIADVVENVAGVYKVRIDRSESYFSQRNNSIDPVGTCMPTSAVAALTYGNFNLEHLKGKHAQPEDALTYFMRHDPAVLAKFKEWYPADAARGLMPNEFHEVVAFAINLWLGANVDTLSTGASLQKLAFHLLKGRPAFASGKWPCFFPSTQTVGVIGHVVCFVGFDTLQSTIGSVEVESEIDIAQITKIIIDDPYGDFHTKYTSVKGNDVEMTIAEYTAIIREPTLQRKLIHFLKRADEVA